MRFSIYSILFSALLAGLVAAAPLPAENVESHGGGPYGYDEHDEHDEHDDHDDHHDHHDHPAPPMPAPAGIVPAFNMAARAIGTLLHGLEKAEDVAAVGVIQN